MIYRYPVNYIAITVPFKQGSHHGVDLAWNSNHGGKNQPIYAPADGVVYSIKDYDKTGTSWGNYVKIDHGNNEYTLMAHMLDGILVGVGQQVKQGDLLGYMGCSGEAYGNHCHFEFYKGGASTNYRVDATKYVYAFQDQFVHADDVNKVLHYTQPTPQPVEPIIDTKDKEIEELKYQISELEKQKEQMLNDLNSQIKTIDELNKRNEELTLKLQNKPTQEIKEPTYKQTWEITKDGYYEVYCYNGEKLHIQ